MLKFQSGWEERPIAFTLVMFLILWLLLGRKSYDLSKSLGFPLVFIVGGYRDLPGEQDNTQCTGDVIPQGKLCSYSLRENWMLEG